MDKYPWLKQFLKIALILSVLDISSGCIFSSHMADFPWITRIMVQETSAQLCVGNLVSEHFILSPVNCYKRWSTRPKDYYSAKDLIIIAGRDGNDMEYCSQERPGDIVSAHPNYSRDPHEYNIAMMEVKGFDFNETALPIMPFLHSAKENAVALLKIQKEKPICDVPTFKSTKYLKNLLEDRESTAVEIVDADECWNRYCPRGHKACLPFFNKKTYVCAQFVNPKKRCARQDLGAPLVCNNVTVGIMKICRENRPMLFQGFGENIVHSLLVYNDMGRALRSFKRETEASRKRKK